MRMDRALPSKEHRKRWNEPKPATVKAETGLRNIYSRAQSKPSTLSILFRSRKRDACHRRFHTGNFAQLSPGRKNSIIQQVFVRNVSNLGCPPVPLLIKVRYVTVYIFFPAMELSI